MVEKIASNIRSSNTRNVKAKFFISHDTHAQCIITCRVYLDTVTAHLVFSLISTYEKSLIILSELSFLGPIVQMHGTSTISITNIMNTNIVFHVIWVQYCESKTANLPQNPPKITNFKEFYLSSTKIFCYTVYMACNSAAKFMFPPITNRHNASMAWSKVELKLKTVQSRNHKFIGSPIFKDIKTFC